MTGKNCGGCRHFDPCRDSVALASPNRPGWCMARVDRTGDPWRAPVFASSGTCCLYHRPTSYLVVPGEA